MLGFNYYGKKSQGPIRDQREATEEFLPLENYRHCCSIPERQNLNFEGSEAKVWLLLQQIPSAGSLFAITDSFTQLPASDLAKG